VKNFLIMILSLIAAFQWLVILSIFVFVPLFVIKTIINNRKK